jgi:hypothetical protein
MNWSYNTLDRPIITSIIDPIKIEWIDIANTEYRYTAIRIPVNTGIPVFLTCFFLSQTELEKVFAASQMLVLPLSEIKGGFFIEIFLQKFRHLYISD